MNVRLVVDPVKQKSDKLEDNLFDEGQMVHPNERRIVSSWIYTPCQVMFY